MYNNLNGIIIHALIPARSGSKSIPKKNVQIYKNYPLLVHSILSAKREIMISKVVVSTDCTKIQKIAIENGADAPFLRPSNISGDLSSDLECFQHYLKWLTDTKQILPDVIVHLRPTYPERNKNILYNCLSTFLKVKETYTSLRTVVPIDKSLFKMYTIKSKQLKPNYLEFDNIKEPYNQARQLLPQTYLHNGCIDIINRSTIENNSMTGDKIYPFIMSKEEIFDIDTPEDLIHSLRENQENPKRSKPIDIPKKPIQKLNNYGYTY
jgi:N-acylneuraminate cytidylyltransferase